MPNFRLFQKFAREIRLDMYFLLLRVVKVEYVFSDKVNKNRPDKLYDRGAKYANIV